MSRDDLKAELKAQASGATPAELTPEEREKLINELSANISVDVIQKQGEYVEGAVRDMMNKSSRWKGNSYSRKAYYAKTYGVEGKILPYVGNYCLAIQQYGFYMASKDLGVEINDEMKKEGFELPEEWNFWNKQGTAAKDTVAGPVHVCIPNMKCDKSSSLAAYVTEGGYVKKGPDGKPLLKDGDLIMAQVGRATNTTSGKHCVRANVDKNGKVTYTAGNGDHLKSPRPASVGMSMGMKVQIFHSEDVVCQNLTEKFQNLTDEQLIALSEKYKDNELYELSEVDRKKFLETRDTIPSITTSVIQTSMLQKKIAIWD